MKPHSPIYDAYRKLTREAADNISQLLPRTASSWLKQPDGGPALKRPPAIEAAAKHWHGVPAKLDQIDTELDTLGKYVVGTWSQTELTQAARLTRIQIRAAESRVAIEGLRGQVLASSRAALAALRDGAYPPRPEPQDAAQEAALAGLKADLQMVLAPLTGSQVPDRMVSRLERAIGDSDALASWLLASSRWPEDYLESRGQLEYAKVWGEHVASALDRVTPPNLAEVRTVYKRAANARQGLPSFEVALNNALPQVITLFADWQMYGRTA
ncbi:hypothetical protein FE697_015315 [Mumia zhuanghuii]|uniref:Uncharacterized protein n=2 Tax=Mumia TaxID=1546255 RepID=A0ABW1QSL6_9ACTN|nr:MULTISPECIES: hypothetical protein [Mumia]KAA1422501.1 hypothetical protein FE697_015315 [Mumia zhuanghuii]